ncbi:MAG: NAD(P)/FAD-dependent oxidoreductase [Streptosporangiaceae bacterium]
MSWSGGLPRSADAVVVGAGLVGASCAAHLAWAGLRVCVVDRGGVTAGTTASGEGNILVSDKPPGPELALALRSVEVWRQLAEESAVGFEYVRKGGVVAARDGAQLAALRRFAGAQRQAGVEVEDLDADRLRVAEPRLAHGLAGGAYYPQDAQVQPMLATAAFLRSAGVSVVGGAEVLAAGTRPDGGLAGVVTGRGRVAAPVVVNAAGPWGGEVASRLGSRLPVRPRRGHVIVTEPLPPLVRHKVYEADYVDTVASDEEGLSCSAVVEGTESGTVLIGSSREFAGFDRTPSTRALGEVTRRAVALFPFLRDVRALRAYVGFRPASPDHLPVVGLDPEVGGLYHATGHEGAGIGLAAATGELVAALVTGSRPAVDAASFDPARFALAGAHG